MLTGDQSEESAASQRLEKILSVCFNSLKTLATKDIKTIAGSLKSNTVVGAVLGLIGSSHRKKKKKHKQAELGLFPDHGIADGMPSTFQRIYMRQMICCLSYYIINSYFNS